MGSASWARFVSGVITPRFPEGLTIFDARGQWRGPAGPIRETTHVLVIYHRGDTASGARIEAIRALYKHRFRQSSVLRADSSACIGF